MNCQDNFHTVLTQTNTTPHFVHVDCRLELATGITRQSFGPLVVGVSPRPGESARNKAQ